jgi:hypothetical protein
MFGRTAKSAARPAANGRWRRDRANRSVVMIFAVDHSRYSRHSRESGNDGSE